MENIWFEEKDNKYIISIDKDAIEADTIHNFVNQLRFEQLSKKGEYKEDELLALSEEIKQKWWEKNKWWILKGINDYKKQNKIE